MVIDQFQRPERELVNMGIDEAQVACCCCIAPGRIRVATVLPFSHLTDI